MAGRTVLPDDSDSVSPSNLTLPYGAVAHVEATHKHRKFVQAAEPDWICLRLSDVQKLHNKGETAASWTPAGTNVITTSTCRDTYLKRLRVDHEAKFLEHFEPDVHIAGDVSVYPEYPLRSRLELIRESMKNALWIDREADCQTICIPLIKGKTRTERELCYQALDHFDHSYAAVYGVRYFTGGGNRRAELLSHLNEIEAEADIDVYLLGFLSEELSDAPPCIKAAGGMNQWRKRAEPIQSTSDADHRRIWEEIELNVEEWLSISSDQDNSQHSTSRTTTLDSERQNVANQAESTLEGRFEEDRKEVKKRQSQGLSQNNEIDYIRESLLSLPHYGEEKANVLLDPTSCLTVVYKAQLDVYTQCDNPCPEEADKCIQHQRELDRQ